MQFENQTLFNHVCLHQCRIWHLNYIRAVSDSSSIVLLGWFQRVLLCHKLEDIMPTFEKRHRNNQWDYSICQTYAISWIQSTAERVNKLPKNNQWDCGICYTQTQPREFITHCAGTTNEICNAYIICYKYNMWIQLSRYATLGWNNPWEYSISQVHAISLILSMDERVNTLPRNNQWDHGICYAQNNFKHSHTTQKQLMKFALCTYVTI